MPIGATLAAAAVTAGSAIISSNKASDAAHDATAAQQNSDAQALALQKAQADRTDAEYAPWRTVGAGALQMLARTMGISVPADTFSYYNLPAQGAGADGTPATGGGAAAGATPAAPQIVTPGVSAGEAYLKANPDVQAEYNRLLPTIDWNSPWAAQHGFVKNDPGAFGLWHYQNSGQAEGRAAPTAVAPVYAPTPAPATGVNAGGATPPPVTNVGGQKLDPNGLPTSTTSSRYGDFYASPDYQFRLNEGMRTLDGNYAAKGLLDSGALGKGLINYGQQAASQEFGSWYNRIASLAGVGQTAVAGSAAAGQAAANNSTGILQASGQAGAAGAATQGGISSGLISSLGGTASGLIQNLGSSSRPIGVQSNNLSAFQTVPQSVNSNVDGLIQPPSTSYSLFGTTG
jgi:hypothetical protein